ncbi:MAG: hypothetical protein Q4F45_08640 [Alistipes sp.]|nr:hypothetical protein [Alistipes sp.]
MKSVLRYIVVLAVAVVAATNSYAQEDLRLVWGVDFDTYFDNREYSACEYDESQTFFSARLTPQVGLKWNEKNRVVVGVDLLADFGDETDFLSEVKPQLYYQFASQKVSAYAGIFPRERMVGDYSDLIMSEASRFYDNRVRGVMGQYLGERGYVEASIDWCGMYSEQSREKFRILSAGRYYFGDKRTFYGGYAFSMFHFAGSMAEDDAVVDNIVVEPYVGAQFNAYFDFDVRLRYLQTMQRDRATEEKSRTPKGGMLQLRMAKWGLFLEEQLYVGDNLQPYYGPFGSDLFPMGYGAELYAGDAFFSTNENIYSTTKIGYTRSFYDDTLRVHCYFAFQHDGVALGCKQVVSLAVRLGGDNIKLGKR